MATYSVEVTSTAERQIRRLARADQIRADLEARGIILEDSAAGTRWKRK